jgi:hypothetical protein
MNAPETIWIQIINDESYKITWNMQAHEDDIAYDRRKTCVWYRFKDELFPTCSPEDGGWMGIEGMFSYCPFCGGRIELEDS